MITYYKIYSMLGCIYHFFCTSNSAIKCHNQTASRFNSIIYSFIRYTITFCISVRNIVINKFSRLSNRAKKCVHECNSRRSIHIIISKHKYLLPLINCFFQSFNCFVHIIHQKRIMKHTEFGRYKIMSILTSKQTSAHQHLSRYHTDIQLCRKVFCRNAFCIAHAFYLPTCTHYNYSHNIQHAKLVYFFLISKKHFDNCKT